MNATPEARARYRDALPQLADVPFLTDGGIETTLIFHDGLELPHFAAYDLLTRDDGADALRRYFEPYAEIARESGVGIVLETATWRANPDWAERLGHGPEELAELNRGAVRLLEEIRADYETRGDADRHLGLRRPTRRRVRRRRGDDRRGGRGVPRRADRHLRRHCGRPRHGDHDDLRRRGGRHRPRGTRGRDPRRHLVHRRDGRAAPERPAAPRGDRGGRRAHGRRRRVLHGQLRASVALRRRARAGCAWTARIRGLRANASRLSHAELDEAEELDEGDPEELATDYVALRAKLPELHVLGGCCGTDHRHIGAMSKAWLSAGEVPG